MSNLFRPFSLTRRARGSKRSFLRSLTLLPTQLLLLYITFYGAVLCYLGLNLLILHIFMMFLSVSSFEQNILVVHLWLPTWGLQCLRRQSRRRRTAGSCEASLGSMFRVSRWRKDAVLRKASSCRRLLQQPQRTPKKSKNSDRKMSMIL